MNITRNTDGKTVTLLLEGWLDSKTAPELGAVINELDSNTEKLIFDLKELEYISSAGLRQVLSAYKKVDGAVKITNVSNEVMDVFKMTGFDAQINIE